MNELVPGTVHPIKWLFPVILLSIIAFMSLYIVRDNYNDRVSHQSSQWITKNTRSDYNNFLEFEAKTQTTGQEGKYIDTVGRKTERERSSQPELDTTK